LSMVIFLCKLGPKQPLPEASKDDA
jgi:hypothetical protein